MPHSNTFRSLLSLLVMIVISSQSVSAHVGSGCLVDCESSVTKNCGVCRSVSDSCCSTHDHKSVSEARCCAACECESQSPSPATPVDSKTDADVDLYRVSISLDSPICGVANFSPRLTALSSLPVAKAGVNAMLCVWLT